MTYYHTSPKAGCPVPKVKIAITLDAETLRELDRTVETSGFPNRSQAIEAAVREKLDRVVHRRLARACARLDPRTEQAMAEEGLGKDAAAWPVY
jgi:Arc/MetJ-type ribon-helix-helix transcriptional regulator